MDFCVQYKNSPERQIFKPHLLTTVLGRSGFKATGRYPFSADNIDYSKIILRKCDEYQKRVIDLAVVDHLKYLETKISPILLEEFKQTNKRNHEWEGKIEAAYLFNVWLELSKDAENSQPKELQEEEPDPNDVTNNLSGLCTPTQSENAEDCVPEPKLTSLSTPDDSFMGDVLSSTSSCLPLTPVVTQ
ncbi:hypothetical protein JTB14_029038 [Gonioctena quinquepunctata]|nr:hypothetical protein JTB14_029038 [Gonioctena quinquepunctata]